jgi:tetratricopeptide (TPR) repeat protein
MYRVALKQFHSYGFLIKNEMCGVPWQKATKRPFASGYTNCGSALAILCFGLSCAAQDSPQAVMQRAIEAQQAGRFAAAVRDYQLLLKQYPGIFEVRANVAAALAGEGLYTEAIAEYQRALALRSDPQVRLNLALAYYKTGDLRLAIDTLKRVHAEIPGNIQAVTLLADCYLKQGQNKDVIALLTPLQQAQPDNEAFIYLLGTALLRDGQTAKGQVIIDKILRNGDSGESRLLMGTAKYAVGDDAGARDDLRRAIELNPKLSEAFSYYGMVLLSTGDRVGARAAFERELQSDPNDFTSNLHLGAMLRTDRDYVGAMKYLRHALQIRPNDPGVLFEIASIEITQGQLVEATRDLEFLVKEAPDFIEAHWSLARIYLRENRRADGERERTIAGRLNLAQRAKDEIAAKSAQ